MVKTVSPDFVIQIGVGFKAKAHENVQSNRKVIEVDLEDMVQKDYGTINYDELLARARTYMIQAAIMTYRERLKIKDCARQIKDELIKEIDYEFGRFGIVVDYDATM